jgi:glycosyltransferase involved in cell wall biosynthesis
VPIVTTSRAGGAEIIRDPCGAVVEPGDSDAVADAIERLRARPRDEVTTACRATAEPFTYAAQVAGFHAVYRGASGDFP